MMQTGNIPTVEQADTARDLLNRGFVWVSSSEYIEALRVFSVNRVPFQGGFDFAAEFRALCLGVEAALQGAGRDVHLRSIEVGSVLYLVDADLRALSVLWVTAAGGYSGLVARFSRGSAP